MKQPYAPYTNFDTDNAPATLQASADSMMEILICIGIEAKSLSLSLTTKTTRIYP